MAISSGLKDRLQSIGSTNGVKGKITGLADSVKNDPATWTQIAAVPGLNDMLKDNPQLLGQIVADPKGSLAAYTGSAGGASAGAGGEGADGTNGFMQNEATFDLLKKYALQEPGTPASIANPPQDVLDAQNVFDAQVSAIEKTASQLETSAAAFLRGELPDDVAKQIRQQTSEAAMRFGLGTDQAAAALTARDLGATSVQLMQQGSQMAGQAAGIRADTAKLVETRREFDRQFALNTEQFNNQTRELNLKGLALEQDRLQFNAKQNSLILGYMTDMVKAQQDLAYRYSAQDIDPTGMMDSFDNLINEMQSLFG